MKPRIPRWIRPAPVDEPGSTLPIRALCWSFMIYGLVWDPYSRATRLLEGVLTIAQCVGVFEGYALFASQKALRLLVSAFASVYCTGASTSPHTWPIQQPSVGTHVRIAEPWDVS